MKQGEDYLLWEEAVRLCVVRNLLCIIHFMLHNLADECNTQFSTFKYDCFMFSYSIPFFMFFLVPVLYIFISLFLTVIVWFIRGQSLFGAPYCPEMQFGWFLVVMDALKSSMMLVFHHERGGELDMVFFGAALPSMSILWIKRLSIGYTRLIYRPFRNFVSSLLL